jgi:WhiB family redox-sensing transcriptional regulator
MTIETRSSNRANPRPKKLLVEDVLPAVADWRHRAACRTEDPEAFFPVGSGGPALRQIEAAKAICDQRCPVRDACLMWALDHAEFGVYGGMSEDERRELKQRTTRANQRARERARKQSAA